MATKTLLTLEDFLQLPEPPDCSYELVEGELITVAPRMFLQNEVRDNVLILLKPFVEAQRLGTVVSLQSFHLFGDTVRIVGVAFVGRGRTLPSNELPVGAPDLAVEVISPSNTPREIDQRVSDFFAAGCKRVWLVYPEHREIYIHGLSGVVRRRGDDTLEDSELLPGFAVKVSSLFGQAEGQG